MSAQEAVKQRRSRSRAPSAKKTSRKKPKVVVEAPEFKVTIGPPRLTRFERARIIGARALQLALGAPPFVPLTPEIRDPIGLAVYELESKALPISIRRTLPDGRYQDIPLEQLLS